MQSCDLGLPIAGPASALPGMVLHRSICGLQLLMAQTAQSAELCSRTGAIGPRIACCSDDNVKLPLTAGSDSDEGLQRLHPTDVKATIAKTLQQGNRRHLVGVALQ